MREAAQISDLELFEYMVHGDQQAFTVLYNRYHSGIYNFLLSIVKIPALAEDLLQDVFMKIWEGASHYQVSTSFSSYLYQTARNKAIDTLRRVARDPLLEDEIRHRLSTGVYQLGFQDQDWKQYESLLHKAIESLPPQRKLAFQLIRQEGKKYEEAAEIMGISRNTLKQHLSLAVESIRKYLLDNGDIIFAIAFLYLFDLA
ncbi:MAG TPA: sigma-70 family RNA polymerase sigma factor [Niabella sp.]|nr:sigma-70 family RNA polymerase sigma factor [Niabella sp.]